jgi:N-acetylmuramoyl-L-alanine amidase
MKLALFPGHVGKDSGAVDRVDTAHGDNYHSIEAVIAWGVVAKMAHFCRELGHDHVIADGGWDTRLATSAGCGAGISVHCDRVTIPGPRGFHSIYYPKSQAGLALAESLDLHLGRYVSHRHHAPHARDLFILRKTTFPCVLVELGFLSNPDDEALLRNDEYQTNLAFQLIAGFRAWMYNGKSALSR